MTATSGVALLAVIGDGCAAAAAVLVIAVLALATFALITSAIVMRRVARWEATLSKPIAGIYLNHRKGVSSPERGDVA